MISVTDWNNDATTFTVTPDGLIATRVDPNGITENRDYNAAGQLTSIEVATTSATLAQYTYGYDDAAQLTSTMSDDALHSSVTENWGYTLLSQLSTIAPNSSYNTTPGGNVTATPTGDAFTYNSAQQIASAANSAAGTSTTFDYDGNGARIGSVTTHASAPTVTTDYGYDARGHLASVDEGTTAVSYTTDASGQRQTRTVGATTENFLWDPNHGLPLLLDDDTHRYLYGPAAVPIAQFDASGDVEYLYADNVGSVRNIADRSGSLTATFDYTEYGIPDGVHGTATSAFGYAYGWTDPDTGIVNLRARDYDPATAQFLQIDPAVDQTQEAYAYASNRPIGLSDPSGLCVLAGDDPLACGMWNSVVQLISPAAAGVLATIDCVNSGRGNAYECGVMIYNPVYSVLEGYSNEIRDHQAGCPAWVIALDGAQGVLGLVGTASIAGGPGSVVGASSSLTWTTVGRWMNSAELAAMRESGVIQWNGVGVHRVATPPSPATYRDAPPGSIYVEYDVPANTLSPHSAGTSVIFGPNSFIGKLPGRSEAEPPPFRKLKTFE